MIKVSGVTVCPPEVEVMLIKRPAVAKAALLGVAPAVKGEIVKAFVGRKPDVALTEPELIAGRATTWRPTGRRATFPSLTRCRA